MGRSHEAVTMDYTRSLYLRQQCVFAIWILLSCVVPNVSSNCDERAKEGLKHALCENRGFQVVPQDLDHDLKVFMLDDNEITYLEYDTFKRYKSLQRIYLARNRIERIAPDAFRHLDTLQNLDLESNKLTTVPSRAFKHLHSVRTLIMKGNPIRYISSDAFQSLVNIETIDFENCWLERIDPNAFSGLLHLKEINLVNNDLRTLGAEMQNTLPESLYIFRLYRNPWNCDCKLRWLPEWLNERSRQDKKVNWHFFANTPRCEAPEMINDINWVELVPNRFACASDIITADKNSTFYMVFGTSITIECEVDGDPPPEVTWQKGTQVIDEFTDPNKYKIHVEKNSHKLWSRLTVLSGNLSDTGEYKCTAENLAGWSSVTYVVREKPPAPPPPKGSVPKGTASKGMNISVIIAIAVGGGCVLIIIIVSSVYLICRSYRRRHAYRVRNYKKQAKNKQPKKDKPQFDDEEQAIVKENDKRAASAATQLLEKKKKEQEKELVKEFYKETDIATAPIVCNDVHESTQPKDKEFKMKIFTSYEDNERTRVSTDLPTPDNEAACAATTDKHQNIKANCNNIKEVTPDLLKTQQQQLVPNHRPPTEPNHVQSCLKKRAEENPYAKPSDLRPGALPKKQSRSAEDLLDSSHDGQDFLKGDPRSRTLVGNHSPHLQHRHDKHDTSPCSNPICLKDPEPSSKSATGLPKPHIKTSQSMGGIHGQAADDSCVGQDRRGHATGKNADKYATLPSKPRQGILHNGNPSRTNTYGVRFPDETPGSPPSNPSKSATYQYQTGRPAKGQLVHHHVSPTRTPIPKYHPQIIRGTSATPTSRMPTKHGSLVTSPASSDHSGEFSPQKPSRSFASTSLDDILSPPFGNTSDRPKNVKKSQKLPKPGEKDEYGTAV